MNNNLPTTRSTTQALADAFKTGSIVFIILTVLESIVQLFYALMDALIGKPLEILFRKIFPKKKSPDIFEASLTKIDPDGAMSKSFDERLKSMPAGDQLKIKQGMKDLGKHYKDHYKDEYK